MQKPIHADVLLRIESTTSESSNTERVNEESRIKKTIEEIKPVISVEQAKQEKTEQNLNMIDDAESMEIIADKNDPISRITSDDEGRFSKMTKVLGILKII